MARYAYVNGRFYLHSRAQVHIEDRGFQFSDGVYEVIPVLNKKMIDSGSHLDRLERSLREIQISMPTTRRVLDLICNEMIWRNQLYNGLLYMQITRGVASRNHAFPNPAVPPCLVMTTKMIDFSSRKDFENGIKVITLPDQRWARRDIKTISLLANCLAKEQAVSQGAFEAWQFDSEGFITEGTSSNAWIITKNNQIMTRANDHDILNGITRLAIIKLAQSNGLQVVIKKFTIEEAYQAQEAFISSATAFVKPVVQIDQTKIGAKGVGSFCKKLLALYEDYIR